MSHFETLWEDAEKLLEHETNVSSFAELAKEAMGKLSVLEQLDAMSKRTDALAPAEMARLKANAMGKLVLVLTQLSQKDGINVYAALKAAIDDRKISLFEAKYK